MSKGTITPVFLGSLVSIVGGFVLLMIAAAAGFAGTGYITSGPDVVAVEPTPMTWLAMSIGIAGVVAIVGGGLGQFVSWVGALVNTAQLPDKTWFLVLLLLGIFNLGFIPMLVYVLAGPDSMPGVAAPVPAPVQPVATPEEPEDLPKAA
jgi:hypothetical protein